ncbi:MAG: helix-turn-helix domain-containing protein [Actinobacteria bacterium]|nr:helix-turn-helix domain-containing protein [Actinomycetota bacterium]
MGPESARLLREARQSAGLTQQQLARRASTTQSVISAYESGHREPSLSTLRRLVSSTDTELVVELRHTSPSDEGLESEGGASRLRVAVHRHRNELLTIGKEYGLRNLRLFGSVARGDDVEGSDVDLLVDLDDHVGAVALAGARRKMEELLNAPVDLVPANQLRAHVRDSAFAEAVAL